MNPPKNSAKDLVGGAITRMNEVAGDDDERNVAVIAIDNVDDAGKASGRVEPIQLSAGGRQMYVAKNNELHWNQDRILRRRYGPRRCREKRDTEQESRRLPATGLMDTRRNLPSAPFPHGAPVRRRRMPRGFPTRKACRTQALVRYAPSASRERVMRAQRHMRVPDRR